MKHFVFLRLSALGDLIHCLPLYYSLVNAHPKSTIHWVVDKKFINLIANLPQIKIHEVDKTNLQSLIISSLKIRKTLKNYPIEAIFNCHDSMNANIVALFLPKPTDKNNHIGLDKNQARDWQSIFVAKSAINQSNKNQHAVLQYLNLAHLIGIKTTHCFDLNRIYEPSDKGDTKVILINLSTSYAHSQRGWNAKTYKVIIQRLVKNISQRINEKKKFQVILTGIKDDKTIKMAKVIKRFADKKLAELGQSEQNQNQSIQLKNKAGQLNLNQWFDAVQSSSLIISPDSAAVHLADSFQIPCLSIYLATNPKKIGPFQNQDFCLDYYQQARLKYLKASEPWDKKIYQENLYELINQKELTRVLDKAFKKAIKPDSI